MSSAPQQLAGVRELAAMYKGVLLDQFGVLHNGRDPYPRAVAAVRLLADAGLKVLVISNSSRRSAGALANLESKGFAAAHFAGAITSGEVTHDQLARRPDQFWQRLGTRCLHLTWGERGAISLDGLDLQVVQDPAAADFVLAHGTEALGAGDGAPATPCSVEEMTTLLRQCAARGGVPMLVANPDVVTVHGDALRVMPGTLAKRYAEMGGPVHLMGKPALIIYERALAMLGLAPGEVVAIGDSLEHDIQGAANAGVASAFVCGGIHADETLEDRGAHVNSAGLQSLCERFGGAAPTYVLPWFEP